MNSTNEILKIKKGEAQKRDVGAVQTGTLFGNWIISEAPDLGFRSILYGQKGKTQAYNFHGNPRFKKAVFKSKLQQ